MAQNYMDKARTWLEGEGFDEATKAEVARLIKEDPAGLEDAFYKDLEFGTGGLRGIMGAGSNRMNRYTVAMATQGLANYIRANVPASADGPYPWSVCISFDSRNNSSQFASITAKVLSANGIHVYLFDSIHPVPLMSYAVRFKKANAGVMITASHNPKEYNGYKVFWSDGAQITAPVDKEIVAEVAKIKGPEQVLEDSPEQGGIEMMGSEIDEAYMNDVLSLMLSPEARTRHSDLKVVYTPLHGCGVRIVPQCLKRLGFTNIFTVKEQEVIDGDFPTVVSPNPEEPAAMKMALGLADEKQADLVLATDPDADRMGIAVRDDNGKMVQFNGNQTASMLTYYILRRWKELGRLDGNQYIVKTIVTSSLLRRIAEDFGVKCYDTLTGFKYIAEIVRMNEGKSTFICGGEESFGFNVGEYVRDKDAPISCCMVCECAAWAREQGMSLWQLMQHIYKLYGYHKEALVSVVRKGAEGAREIQRMISGLRADPPRDLAGSRITEIIDYENPEKTGLPKSNVLQFFDAEGDVVTVRPSGTEPKIKFYFGAAGNDTDAKIEALKAQFTS